MSKKTQAEAATQDAATVTTESNPASVAAAERHPAHGVLDRLAALAATFGSHAEGEINKLVNEARALLS
jgi:hypothetical protein